MTQALTDLAVQTFREMSAPKCSEPGCNRVVLHKGLCGAHYSRHRKQARKEARARAESMTQAIHERENLLVELQRARHVWIGLAATGWTLAAALGVLWLID